ncbi:unnamed protein product [Caenorhabditis auriculariae]|uniref:EF-hand domain-containing protein n=1 Tax=Caenorhabditis auriculariae TaxID=2777116 RepID=A0A8S1GMW7_9PELO|nr:unnamed protein product [Caenorhabditis auriculariae]
MALKLDHFSLLQDPSGENDPIKKEFARRVHSQFALQQLVGIESLRKECNVMKKLIRDPQNMRLDEDNFREYIPLTTLMKLLEEFQETGELRKLFTARCINNLVRISKSHTSIIVDYIESYLDSSIQTAKIHSQLLQLSPDCKHVLRNGLKSYIIDQLQRIFADINENQEYYSEYVVAVIFFLLEGRRKNKIPINELMASKLLIYFEEFVFVEIGLIKRQPIFEILSLNQYRQALNEFRILDRDNSGMLSYSKLCRFQNDTFNTFFLKRVPEISQSYISTFSQLELDFRGFVDFYTAVKFKHTRAGAKFHFELFDLNNDGIIDADEVKQFCSYVPNFFPPDEASPDFENLTTELLDMIKSDARSITLEEFLASPMRATFSGVISNYTDFRCYETREES